MRFGRGDTCEEWTRICHLRARLAAFRRGVFLRLKGCQNLISISFSNFRSAQSAISQTGRDGGRLFFFFDLLGSSFGKTRLRAATPRRRDAATPFVMPIVLKIL
jgi:hypothetical protein